MRKYVIPFVLLNILVLAAIACMLYADRFTDTQDPFEIRLDAMPNYIKEGFTLDADLSGFVETQAGKNVTAKAGGLTDGYERHYLQPGSFPNKEFTIITQFDYSDRYEALMAVPNITLGLWVSIGDSYQIYLNGVLIAEDWHVEDGKITSHRFARNSVVSFEKDLLVNGINTLTYRVYGDLMSTDTGLHVSEASKIGNLSKMQKNETVTIFIGGIYLCGFVIFLTFYLLYPQKMQNLLFSQFALTMGCYSMLKGKLTLIQAIFPQYNITYRFELFFLFSLTYFGTLLIYRSGKEKLNLIMKIFTVVWCVSVAALFIPGHQFALDLLNTYLLTFPPFMLYALIGPVIMGMLRDMRKAHKSGEGAFAYLGNAIIKTPRGMTFVAATIPVIAAVLDTCVYYVTRYQSVLLSSYGFLIFFANIAFSLSTDIASMSEKLELQSAELQKFVAKQKDELSYAQSDIEKAASAHTQLLTKIQKEVANPLHELSAAIELRILQDDVDTRTHALAQKILEAQNKLSQKLNHFINKSAEDDDADFSEYLRLDRRKSDRRVCAGTGERRHFFVVNPKSFVTLHDLKEFLLSVEKCFSVGHREEYNIYISRYPRDGVSAVKRYLSGVPKEDPVRVYAVGGDGITFDCLNGLAKYENAELAIIPYGSANDVVRSFGKENMSLFRDIKLMSKAPTILTDLIHCDNKYAISQCSIGLEAKATQVFTDVFDRINTSASRKYVPLLYQLGAVKCLLDGSQSNVRYKLTIDGRDCSGEYLFINIGNMALNGGTNIPNPYAKPDDGQLDVILCDDASALCAIRMIPGYTKGGFEKFPKKMSHRRVKELCCEREQMMTVILDGETFRTRSVSVKILPKSVKVVTPNNLPYADYSLLSGRPSQSSDR